MKTKNIIPVLILAASFIFQISLIFSLEMRPPEDKKSNDQQVYHAYGQRIANGENYYEFGMRSPLYPYFLGMVYKISVDPALVRVIQVVGHMILSLAI